MRYAAAVLCLIAAPAMAQTMKECDTREAQIAHLRDGYGEQPRAIGVDLRGAIVEIWANIETQTFTILRVTPDGQACLISAGEVWQDALPPEPAGDDL